MIRFSPLFVLFLLPFYSRAQRPVELLEKWAAMAPIEKQYLHLDRDNYAAGDTAWFKAYLSSQYLPDTISSVLYTEVWKPGGQLLYRKTWPVLLGITNGQFEWPDTLSTGSYLVRAFTPSQLNQDPAFLYERRVHLQGKKAAPSPGVTASVPHLKFFPEGGNLVNGITQSVAFQYTDANGSPLSGSGTVVNEAGVTQAGFSTYQHGLGVFSFTPVKGERYRARLDGMSGEFPLPAASDTGIGFSVIPHPQGFFFEIQAAGAAGNFQPAYLVGQMQHQVVFTTRLRPDGNGSQGVIDTRKLRSGILQITVFSATDMPLAERLCFVDNKEYLLSGKLTTDTLNTAARGRNRFTLELADTVMGSFSISVTDADADGGALREENILTRLLLSSDLPGTVYRPAWYFQTSPDSASMGLDLLMMTHGWRRFRWQEILQKGLPSLRYQDPGFIRLRGRALLRDTRRPFADGNLALLISGQHTRRITQLLTTNAQGEFSVDSLVFFDKCRLLFSDIRGKKSKYIDIELSADSLHRRFSIPDPAMPAGVLISPALYARLREDYDRLQKASGKMLDEVRVTATRKSPLQQVEERYTRGLFSGDATKSIDLVNNDEATTYLNIFDYLQNRVNGLQVMNNGLDYGIFYRQGPSVSSMGNIPMTLFLDEVETDVSVLATVPASQVALVKVYNTFAGAWGNAPGGVLAVYTKKGEDMNNSNGFANVAFYNGYSVVREFYAPDYGPAQPKPATPDQRLTLDWRPSIFVSNVNPRIAFRFYNNDRSKRFRVVAEGMTTDGRLLMVEEVVGSPEPGVLSR